MNQRDRERVERASGNSHQKQQGRSATNAQVGADNVQAKLTAARAKMRDSAKAFVLGGVADALEDIANGDFGEVGNEIFGAFDNFISEIEQGHKTLKNAEIDPKYSLPYQEQSKTIEVAAAIAN